MSPGEDVMAAAIVAAQAAPDVGTGGLVAELEPRPDFSLWTVEDDLSLKHAMESGAAMEALARGAIRFSRRFTIKELRARWRVLLYDPVIAPQAALRMVAAERAQTKPTDAISIESEPSSNLEFQKNENKKSKLHKLIVKDNYYQYKKKKKCVKKNESIWNESLLFSDSLPPVAATSSAFQVSNPDGMSETAELAMLNAIHPPSIHASSNTETHTPATLSSTYDTELTACHFINDTDSTSCHVINDNAHIPSNPHANSDFDAFNIHSASSIQLPGVNISLDQLQQSADVNQYQPIISLHSDSYPSSANHVNLDKTSQSLTFFDFEKVDDGNDGDNVMTINKQNIISDGKIVHNVDSNESMGFSISEKDYLLANVNDVNQVNHVGHVHVHGNGNDAHGHFNYDGVVNHLHDGGDNNDNDEDNDNDDDDVDIPSFSDVEYFILDMDLDPGDEKPTSARKESIRLFEKQKNCILRLEAFAFHLNQKFFTKKGAFAALCGKRRTFFISKAEVCLGRNTNDNNVDIDISLEGKSNKVSRKQAFIALKEDGHFYLKNVGRKPLTVNKTLVQNGQRAILGNLCLIEVGGIRLLFEINFKLVREWIQKNVGVEEFLQA